MASSSRTTEKVRLGASRSLMRLILASFALTLAQAGMAADPYPLKGRVVKIVVPTGAGSAFDLLARTYGKVLGEDGINTIVENKPGAEGVPGVMSALASPADGYTMLLVSNSITALNPVLIPDLPYDPLKDFEPLVATSQAGLVGSLGASTTFKSAREFVQAARANPGKYTCAHMTSNTRMACDYFQASAGIQLLNVPYKTAAAGVLALAAGEVDVLFLDTSSFLSHWKSGRVRPIGYATAKRMPSQPEIPTFSEEGIPDFLMNAWYAFYFKKGTPRESVAAMSAALRKAADSATVKSALATFVHEPLNLEREQITEANRLEIQKWKRLIREHHIELAR